MTLQQLCVPLEMAKKLRTLGVAKESFASWYYHDRHKEWTLLINGQFDVPKSTQKLYPAYTSGELGEMLPYESGMKFFSTYYNDHIGAWYCEYRGFKASGEHESFDWSAGIPPPLIHETEGDTESECRGEMIEYLIESGSLTVDEVNK